jgi:uncharacterized Zn-binding protein involved in type VI secretion
MPPAARVNDSTAHGKPLSPGPGSSNVIIGGVPAWRAMVDQHVCPITGPAGPDGVGLVIKGSPTVFINGQMACRLGDIVIEKPGLAVGPVNPIVSGCPTVIIGEVGMGGVAASLGLGLSKAKAMGAGYLSLEDPQTLLSSVIKSPDKPDKKEWIGIRLVNEQGDPYQDDTVNGVLTDGNRTETQIGAGHYFAAIPGGSCKFAFPNFYDEMKNWKPED